MNNLTGETLDDTYFAFFLFNTLPYLPQTVYQDPNGLIPWANPIEFQPSGGLPNNLYFPDGAVYRIEIRQGNNQSLSPLIWLVENYAPGGTGDETQDQLLTASNIITNPQFADVYFKDSLTLTTAGTYDIAPGWKLILTGTGSTTVTQTAEAGSPAEQFGNPPYYLTLNNSGWNAVQLVQQLDNNGAIFGGGAIAAYFLASATGSPQTVTVAYAPSTGSGQNIVSTTVVTGGFNQYGSAIDLPDSTNTDEGLNAHVQIQFNMSGNSQLSFTNIQVVGQSSNLSDITKFPATPSANNIGITPVFQEIPYERIVDQEFHVYRDSIIDEPKESLLAGWNFANNPWQFTTTASTNVATNKYTADQTVVIQQAYVTSATGNNVAVGRDTAANNYGFQVKAVTANNQFALLQYIDPTTIRGYWGGLVSCLVKAFITTGHATTVRFKMRLIYKSGLPNTIAQHDPINTWTAGGDPVAAAGYTLVAPPLDQSYTLSSATPTQFSFDGIQLPASDNDNMTLGLLVYTIDNMNQAATEDTITFDDISLIPNEFAMPTQSETFDDTLRRCQYYFEKSYNISTLPGTATNTIGVSNTLTSDAVQTEMTGMDRAFKVTKRKTPLTTWYNPNSGASGTLYNVTDTADTSAVSSTKYTGQFNTGYPAITAPGDLKVIIGHWTAGARIGVASET